MAEYYDKYQKRGAIHWDWYENGKQLWYKKVVDNIIEHFRTMPVGTVFDIGCGDGLVSAKLADIHKVIGIDIDPTGIRIAREKTSHMKNPPIFLVMDFKDISTLKYKFDYAVLLNVIEHFEKPFEVLYKLLQSNQQLKNILIITDCPSGRFGRHHINEFTPVTLYNECKILGLSMSKFETGTPEFHGVSLQRNK